MARGRPRPIDAQALLARLQTPPDVRYRRHGETRWRKGHLVSAAADAVTVRTDNGNTRDLNRALYETEQPMSRSTWEPVL
jgi:hypothetical protein